MINVPRPTLNDPTPCNPRRAYDHEGRAASTAARGAQFRWLEL
jgi:hypothetical protein